MDTLWLEDIELPPFEQLGAEECCAIARYFLHRELCMPRSKMHEHHRDLYRLLQRLWRGNVERLKIHEFWLIYMAKTSGVYIFTKLGLSRPEAAQNLPETYPIHGPLPRLYVDPALEHTTQTVFAVSCVMAVLQCLGIHLENPYFAERAASDLFKPQTRGDRRLRKVMDLVQALDRNLPNKMDLYRTAYRTITKPLGDLKVRSTNPCKIWQGLVDADFTLFAREMTEYALCPAKHVDAVQRRLDYLDTQMELDEEEETDLVNIVQAWQFGRGIMTERPLCMHEDPDPCGQDIPFALRTWNVEMSRVLFVNMRFHELTGDTIPTRMLIRYHSEQQGFQATCYRWLATIARRPVDAGSSPFRVFHAIAGNEKEVLEWDPSRPTDEYKQLVCDDPKNRIPHEWRHSLIVVLEEAPSPSSGTGYSDLLYQKPKKRRRDHSPAHFNTFLDLSGLESAEEPPRKKVATKAPVEEKASSPSSKAQPTEETEKGILANPDPAGRVIGTPKARQAPRSGPHNRLWVPARLLPFQELRPSAK